MLESGCELFFQGKGNLDASAFNLIRCGAFLSPCSTPEDINVELMCFLMPTGTLSHSIDVTN